MAEEKEPDAWAVFLPAYEGWRLVLNLVVGYRSGLLEALCDAPGSGDDIAARAGTDPRLTLEWLRYLTTKGLAEIDGEVFRAVGGLDELRDVPGVDSPVDILSEVLDRLPGTATALTAAVRTGRGVAPQVYGRPSARLQNLASTLEAGPHLLPEVLAPVPGLIERLEHGCRVLEVGSGAGWALEVMAEAFTASSFTGLDLDEHCVDLARQRLAPFGERVVVEVRDVLSAQPDSADVVLAIDLVHDLPDPLASLRTIRRALAPDGVLVVSEADATGDFSVDRHSPLASQYGPSFGHCIPASQHAGGPGLGAMWGRPAALQLLAEAGFDQVDVHVTPSHAAVFACRPAGQ